MSAFSYLRYLRADVFVSVLWLAGFLCALMPFPQYEAEAFGLSFLLVCGAFVISLWQGDLRWPENRVAQVMIVIAAAFWGLALLSSVLSGIFYISFIYFCYFSVFPLTALIVFLQRDNSAFLKVVVSGVVVIMSLLAIGALVQFFVVPEMLVKGLVQWPLANPNALGALFSFGVFGALGGVFFCSHRTLKLIMAGLCVVFIAALCTTGSRGALLSMVFGLSLFAVLGRSYVSRFRSYLIVIAVSVVIVLGLFHLAAPQEAKPIGDVAMRTVAGKEKLLWDRPAIWGSTLDMIKDHVWTGTGIGTFYLYYPAYRTTDFKSAGRAAHSDPLQFWSEMGVLSPLLFYGFILCALFMTWQICLKNRPFRIECLIPFCALFSMVLHTHITFNFYVLSLLMLAGLYLGLWGRCLDESDNRLNYQYIIRFGGVLLTVGVVSLFVLFHGAHLSVNYARKSLYVGDMQKFSVHLNRAHTLSGGRHAGAYVLAATHIIGVLENAPMLNLPLDQKKVLYQKGMEHVMNARIHNPRLVSALYAKARLISLGQGYGIQTQDNPAALLDEAIKMDPRHIGVRMMRADLYFKGDQKQQALQVLREGLVWAYQNQNPIRFYQKTAALAVQLGDKDTMVLALEKLRHLQQE